MLPSPRLMIAPMMGWTTASYRHFIRLLSKHVQLYTEMCSVNALIYNVAQRHYLLKCHAGEQPLGLQLGGSDPKLLVLAAQYAQDYGHTQINLNIGCPSTRVQHACFGAVLFKQPEHVANCVSALRAAVSLPITIKTRIAVDDHDSYSHLVHFIRTVNEAGCQVFIIHARKAWLHGLNPKKNRTIPPLRYDWVYQIKRDFPDLQIVLNGGIDTVEQIQTHLQQVDAVMIGRAAWHHPYLIALAEHRLHGTVLPDRLEILNRYIPYLQEQHAQGKTLNYLLAPLFGLFHKKSGARQWRHHLGVMLQKTPHLLFSNNVAEQLVSIAQDHLTVP